MDVDEEIEICRQWAWNNYKAGDDIKPYWHPVVRRECERINEGTYKNYADRCRGRKEASDQAK